MSSNDFVPNGSHIRPSATRPESEPARLQVCRKTGNRIDLHLAKGTPFGFPYLLTQSHMTFQEYLVSNGHEIPVRGADRKRLYAAYRQVYKKENQKSHRCKIRRLEVRLSPDEYRIIKQEASRHKRSLNEFAKAAILGYLNRTYVVPNESQIRELEMGIRRIGNGQNQVIHRAHLFQHLDASVVQELSNHLHELEVELRDFMREPLDLETLIRLTLNEQPLFLQVLTTILHDYQSQNP